MKKESYNQWGDPVNHLFMALEQIHRKLQIEGKYPKGIKEATMSIRKAIRIIQEADNV